MFPLLFNDKKYIYIYFFDSYLSYSFLFLNAYMIISIILCSFFLIFGQKEHKRFYSNNAYL